MDNEEGKKVLEPESLDSKDSAPSSRQSQKGIKIQNTKEGDQSLSFELDIVTAQSITPDDDVVYVGGEHNGQEMSFELDVLKCQTPLPQGNEARMVRVEPPRINTQSTDKKELINEGSGDTPQAAQLDPDLLHARRVEAGLEKSEELDLSHVTLDNMDPVERAFEDLERRQLNGELPTEELDAAEGKDSTKGTWDEDQWFKMMTPPDSSEIEVLRPTGAPKGTSTRELGLANPAPHLSGGDSPHSLEAISVAAQKSASNDNIELDSSSSREQSPAQLMPEMPQIAEPHRPSLSTLDITPPMPKEAPDAMVSIMPHGETDESLEELLNLARANAGSESYGLLSMVHQYIRAIREEDKIREKGILAKRKLDMMGLIIDMSEANPVLFYTDDEFEIIIEGVDDHERLAKLIEERDEAENKLCSFLKTLIQDDPAALADMGMYQLQMEKTIQLTDSLDGYTMEQLQELPVHQVAQRFILLTGEYREAQIKFKKDLIKHRIYRSQLRAQIHEQFEI